MVALAARHTPHLNTFSIGFRDEPFFDETKYAKLVAERYKTNHTVFSLTNHDLYDHIYDMLNYLDEPFADSSALAVYILSKRTRQKATVALSGDGADEMFGGYNKHMGEFQVRQGGFKAEAVTGLDLLWDVLPKSRNSFFGNRVRQFQRFSRGMLSGPKDRYWDWASVCLRKGCPQPAQPRQPAAKSATSWPSKRRTRHSWTTCTPTATSTRCCSPICRMVLPYDMLAKVDMMSMANSLEVRPPFLDYERGRVRLLAARQQQGRRDHEKENRAGRLPAHAARGALQPSQARLRGAAAQVVARRAAPLN